MDRLGGALHRRDFIRAIGGATASLSVAARGWLGIAAIQAQTHLMAVSPVAAQDAPTLLIEIVAQIGHSNAALSAAFSPDGRTIVSGSRDNTLKLWDTETGRELRTLRGHLEEINAAAFSPDGRTIISCGGDKTLKLWDAATGRELRTFKGHGDSVNAVVFSPDGSTVVSGSSDKTLKIWDLATGRELSTLTFHLDQINAVAFSPDGRAFVSGSGDKTLKLWEAATGRELRTLKGHGDSVNSVAFSPDSLILASGSSDNTLKVWDVAAGRALRTLKGHMDRINAVAISHDGRTIVSASGQYMSGKGDYTLRFWDLASGREMRRIKGHGNAIQIGKTVAHGSLFQAVAFSPDSRAVVSGSNDARPLKLWEQATGRELRTLQGQTNSIKSAKFSPDGSKIVSGGDSKALTIWDAMSGRALRTIAGHIESVQAVAFSPDGSTVLSGSGDEESEGAIRLWETATGRLVKAFKGHSRMVSGVAFSPDGRSVASGSYDGTLQLWEVTSGRRLHSFTHSSLVFDVAFSPDGRTVMSGSDIIKLWDTASGREVHTLAGKERDGVYAVTFSPDGRTIVSGGDDQTLTLWNAETGREVGVLRGHKGRVLGVAISPDGRTIASCCADRTVRLWDAASMRELHSIADFGSACIAFSRDGRSIISGSVDGAIRRWDVTGQLIATSVPTVAGEWLTMTPSGFFAASRDGGDAISIVRGLVPHDVNQMYQALYDPDLVREAISGDRDEEVKKAAAELDLKKVLDSGPSPRVSITLSSTGGSSAHELITPEVRVTDQGGGIGKIEWRVNGVTVAVTPKSAGKLSEPIFRREIALDPGENTIEVVAYNSSNLLASLPIRSTVTFTGSVGETRPKLHILAIGINAYVDKGWIERGRIRRGFPELNLAVKDAQAFATEMQRAAGSLYRDVRVTLVLDKDATRENIDKTVDGLAKDIQPRDTFILFAAAHGTSENGRFYLIPQDYQGSPVALQEHAIGQDRLQDWLANRIKAKKAILLLDTCESGALVSKQQAASEAGIGRLYEATGRPVLTAAAEGQFAHEGLVASSGERHGVFTWALLEALRKGDSNGNGTIELSELVAFVQTTVPKLAIEHGGVARAETATPRRQGQTARFGSRGEDFSLVQKLR